VTRYLHLDDVLRQVERQALGDAGLLAASMTTTGRRGIERCRSICVN
jgi:hypothetical protein